ncbi:hypothetical protein Dsin_033161 [Dipteronia sinensis]|uniref:Endonuclease/exonuclease/phosphatase domain-containing protein n=1 Tax=Dipteronia sinensis TaxID=43782 RepID=A0AAE0DK18_9ROSI|nr:hypothetical protein Dsin_033161 [Dipteronia sinensis]
MLWCIGGDFNTVLDPLERRGGGVCNMGSVRSFCSFVLRARVVDLPLHGVSYTWCNNRETISWARLDRFLVSPWIHSWFPKLMQKGIPRSLSDHNAILIGEESKDWGPGPFRFYDAWL